MHRTMLASASPPKMLAGRGVDLGGDRPEKEAIHSGQFMVSHFIAEAQDDEDELAVPVPEVGESKSDFDIVPIHKMDLRNSSIKASACRKIIVRPPIGIETSLAKLFQCMSLAYRQKLTSPKWNRFRGIRLRWKDKIRLNNVIWRCWHMQFIKKRNTLICQFASPLDVDTHNKPEAVVLEGKYWKRKLAAVTAEYKKWRMFYRNQVMGHNKDAADMLEMELLSWNSQPMDENMLVDEDYMGLMSDTLFSTITNQPFVFPDSREIAKAGLADFIQPSLGPLQPNLDDYMDTFEPFQDLLPSRLATVPEESQSDSYKADLWPYYDNFPNGMPVHPPVNLPIETHQYPMQPPQLPPPPLPPPVSKLTPPMDFADPAMYVPMISNPKSVQAQPMAVPLQQQGKPLGMDLVPMSTKLFLSDLNIPPPAQTYVSNQQIRDTHTMSSYKLPNATDLPLPSSPAAASYKFSPPTLPNIKFTSQPAAPGGSDALAASYPLAGETKKDEKMAKARGARGRPRSRSSTRETIKKPPLLSAVSDPALITTAGSALLTQLLKNNDGAASRVILSERPPERKSFVRVKEEHTPIPILPQPPPPPPTTLILTPLSMTPLRPAVNVNLEPLMLNAINASSGSPSLPDACLNSPTPSQDSLGSPTREPGRDSRRVGHIHAEQKRRYNIKNGFDMIHSLIPHLNQNPNAKLSKAAMLQKGAEYIKQLRAERNMLTEEMDLLRQQIETLNASISNCQSLLPATGAPVSRRRDDKLQEMFDSYVRTRTAEDWKFWIFSLVFRPLLTTFNNVVSTTSMDDLYRSTMLWVEQHCTLVDLRPIVLNSLRYLCTRTDILSEPEKLPDEARQMVQQATNRNQAPL